MAGQNDEENNFIRMFRLVTGVGTELLRTEFDKYFPPVNLVSDLTTNEPKLRRLHSERRLTSKQMSVLFPTTGIPTSGDFDVTLMVCLIRNLTPIVPPLNGFDNLPMPPETSAGADIARIKYYRNMLAHFDNNRIPTIDFNVWWQDLSNAIVRLGGNQYQAKCDSIKSMQMISEAEKQTLRQEIQDLQEEVWDVRLRVNELETQVVPRNIQDQINEILELWETKDQMFVSTEGAKYVLQCIKEKNCVTVTGHPGIGKTFIVRHIALHLKREGYAVIPTCFPKDIRDFTRSAGCKTLFVIDDICGHYSLNQKYLDDWRPVLSYVSSLLRTNKCKIIATCRLQVYRDERFKDLSIFTSNECNLSSEELCLSPDEKSSLAKKYFGDQANRIIDIRDRYDFFPLLCSLYNEEEFSDLNLFFFQPFKCYKQELDKLLNEGDEGRYKYCVLALVVMFNNKLRQDYISDKNSKIIEHALNKSKLSKATSTECLIDALHSLDDTFIVKNGDLYKTIHDKLFDFLAKYFGDEMLVCIIDNATSEFINERIFWKRPESIDTDIDFTIYIPDNCLDVYISRLVNDWSDGKVLHLFVSRNIKSSTFIVKLLEHIKEYDKSFQIKLANITADNSYRDTILMGSCFVGDVNLTQWVLDNTVNNCGYIYRVLRRCAIYCDKVTKWLYRDSIVNQCRDDGASPVYKACQEGHYSILDKLIECGGDVNKFQSDGASPLYIACQKGHVKILERLIQSKANINKCKINGTSPVYIACQHGHVKILNRLIECKADINKCDNDGRSPVYAACYNGHLSILNRLIECKADLSKCMNNGVSPVYIACQEGHLSILNRLIQSKADVNKCDNSGTSPVYVACEKGYLCILDRLIKCKADIHKCRNDRRSPVHISCVQGHLPILNKLIQFQADINKCNCDGASPVYIACQNGHVNILKRLIGCRVDINKCNNNGASPVYIACSQGHVPILNMLLESKADVNKCNKDGNSPLHTACYNNHIDVLFVLLELYKKNKREIDLCNKFEYTPLFFACDKGNVQIVTTLLEHGANPHHCNKFGKSPLHFACYNNHINVVLVLLKVYEKNKVILDVCDNNGNTPLHEACKKGHVQIFKMLLQHGANPNQCNKFGKSPLHFACSNNHIDVVLVLLKVYEKNKVMISLCDNDGNTPLYEACQKGNFQIVTTLLQHGADPHQCNRKGKSPLQVAIDNGDIDVVATIKHFCE